MKIGIFTDTYTPYINGVTTSIIMLKNALEKMGHTVYIVTVNAEKISYKYEDGNKVVRIPGIPIGIYDYRLTGIYPLKAISKIKNWNLDIIHSHTEFGVGTFARIISKQYNIPIVHTYHTMYEDYVHYITKGFFDGASKKIVEYLTKFYCDKTASELIVPTKKTYNLFKQKYQVDRNVHIIPTGIEIEKFYKETFKIKDIFDLKLKMGLKTNDFVILYVGRIAKEKNIEFLIDNMKDITKNSNAKLVIIGSGPDLDSYQKRVIKLKLEKSIIFTGKVPWEEINKYYQIGDVFVTASTSETQGLTVIEAMAASLPVVAINDESFTNIVIDDLNGYIFKNKKEYKQAIKTIIEEPFLKARLSKQARINSENYSSKFYGQRVCEIYKQAIEKENNKKETFLDKISNVIRRLKK